MNVEISFLRSWEKKLSELMIELDKAFVEKNLLLIDSLDKRLQGFQEEICCSTHTNKDNIRYVLNNIALIICDYDDAGVVEKLNLYQKVVLNFFKKEFSLTPKPKISGIDYNSVRKISIPVGRKKLLNVEHDGVREVGKTIKKNTFSTVSVFFGTNRKITKTGYLKSDYSSDRGEMSYGECLVSIPQNHTSGEIESPSRFRLEFFEDPNKHIVLQRVDRHSLSDFWTKIGAISQTTSDDRALVFIHGFNMSFEAAAKRTAQISYDLKFNGTPFFFSWPSKNNITEYLADKESSDWSVGQIAMFLEEIAGNKSVGKIYLIAHSMGGSCVVKALEKIRKNEDKDMSKFQEIILAAPDIDAQLFSTTIAPIILDEENPLTLYVSSKDKALKMSKNVNKCYRLGCSKNNLVVLPGMETIDAGPIDMSFLGHSYFSDERIVLHDMHYLIDKSIRPDERAGLKNRYCQNGKYWFFAK